MKVHQSDKSEDHGLSKASLQNTFNAASDKQQSKTYQRRKEDDEYDSYSNLGSNQKERRTNLSCSQDDMQCANRSQPAEDFSGHRPILTSGDDELPAEREHKLSIVRMQFMKHQALS